MEKGTWEIRKENPKTLVSSETPYREQAKMPEAGSQTESRDTHRNVYTQVGKPGEITVEVIVEYRTNKIIVR